MDFNRLKQAGRQRRDPFFEVSAEERVANEIPAPDVDPHDSLERDAEAQVGRSAALMSVLVIVSRITGFFRTWGQAYALGVTVTASCYTVANNLPNQLYELVMGGMLVTAFLPVYLSVKERSGRKGANEYTSNLLSLVVLVMGAVAALGLVFAVQVVWTQSFSATSEFDGGLAVYFFRFFVIEVVLYALSSVLSGVLNAERDYFWSTAAPIFNNFVCTASFFLYVAFAASNPTLAILCLAVGNPLGVAIQVVMQVPSLRRHGIRLRPHVDLHDPAIRETLSIGIPSLVVTFASFVTVSVQTSCALSVTAQGASIAYYSRLWYTLPYAILAIPITTAMFTELSDRVSKGDMAGYVRGVASGTSRIMFFLVPFSLFLVVFAPALITLLAAGKFSAEDISTTTLYLQVLSLSLPVYGICTYLQKVCSSLREMRLFAIASVVAGIVQVAFCFVFTPLFGLNVVALSSLLFFVAVDWVTFESLRRELGHIGMRGVAVATLRSLGLGAVGAAVGAAVLWALSTFLAPLGSSALRALLYALAGGIPAVAVTFGLALALRVPEASFIQTVVAKLTGRS
jgi:putative peptidoglycan lipid II flippase